MSNQLDQIDRLLDSSLSTFNTSELQSENKMKERLIHVVAGDESKEYFGHPYTTQQIELNTFAITDGVPFRRK